MERVSVSWGEAHPFWDVSFSDEVHEEAGVERDEIGSISIRVDSDTGEIELNPGYAPGSVPRGLESALFSRAEDEILEAMLYEMRCDRLEDPAYDAFRAKHAAPHPR